MSESSDKTAATRRRLHQAALALFRARGFEATSADEIAARAGVSRATFFNHFGSKAAVLRCFGQDLEEKLRALAAARKPGSPPLDEIRRLLATMADAVEAQRRDLRTVFLHSLRDEAYVASPTPARRHVVELVTRLVAEAQERGEARTDLPAVEIAGLVIGLYEAQVFAIVFRDLRAAPAIERLWTFALSGIRHPSSPGLKRGSRR